MKLNTIQPAAGSKSARHRVGRGVGSGWGKTAGRGHKGQKSRAGGFHKVGFEGGQMPLHRRLPKRGFTSWTHEFVAEIRLSDLEKLGLDEVNLADLIAADVVKGNTKEVRVIANGEINRKVVLNGMVATKGAKEAIEKAGGKVVEPVKAKAEQPKKVADKKAAKK